MEEMTSPRAVDAAAQGFQEEAADLECRLRAADEARAAVEGRLRERDAECQGLPGTTSRGPRRARGLH